MQKLASFQIVPEHCTFPKVSRLTIDVDWNVYCLVESTGTLHVSFVSQGEQTKGWHKVPWQQFHSHLQGKQDILFWSDCLQESTGDWQNYYCQHHSHGRCFSLKGSEYYGVLLSQQSDWSTSLIQFWKTTSVCIYCLVNLYKKARQTKRYLVL